MNIKLSMQYRKKIKHYGDEKMKIIVDKNLLLQNNEKFIKFIRNASQEFFCFDLTNHQSLKEKYINCKFLKSDNISHKSDTSSNPAINHTDDYIIYVISQNKYDFYITNNESILSLSQNVGIGDRILTQQDAYKLFTKQTINYSLNSEFLTVDKIDVNDKIFDRLKISYSEFDDWFKRIQKQKRDAVVYYNNDRTLGGIVIFKEEREEIKLQDEILANENRLKVSTFIVTANGYKIGELFIRIIIEKSSLLNINEIYLTHFVDNEDTDYLVSLIKQYGFTDIGSNKRGERIFIKKILPDQKVLNFKTRNDILEFDKKYYPTFYNGPKVNKFLVPIRPQYYNRLFLQPKNSQLTLSEFVGPLMERNTIKKAYISKAKIKTIEPGDIIIFYCSHDKQALTALGIVEKTARLDSRENIIKMIGKRSVFSESEIEDTDQLVILFTYNCRIASNFNLSYLKKNGILKGAPQSIMKFQNYNKVINNGGLNGCNTFN